MCWTYHKSKGGDTREVQSRMVPPPPKKKKTGSSHLKLIGSTCRPKFDV